MKKKIGLVVYVILFTLLVGGFSFFRLMYHNELENKKKLIKVAKGYDILSEDEDVSFDKDTKKLEELEEKLLLQFSYSKDKDNSFTMESMSQDNEVLGKEINRLEQEIMELNTKKDQLGHQYDTLKKQKEEREAEARELASTYKIEGVTAVSQYPSYPTGCECVALYMLLRYYGISTTIDDIISRLPQGGWLYTKEGVRYGGNPELEFVGSPYDVQSFGVYEGPIIQVANSYKAGMVNGKGSSLNTVLEIVRQGRPVMVWTTINLLNPYVIVSWMYDETMEQINWYAHEHAVVIVGFSDNYVIVADPNDGTIKKQRRDLFESRYNFMGKRNVYY